jgi:non-lysosomal glucosylceramidase
MFKFGRSCLGILIVTAVAICSDRVSTIAAPQTATEMDATSTSRIFPSDILQASWQPFPVLGYSAPVTGVVFRGRPQPTCGMPLGGLDTGCLDIDANGLLGYATIFNQLINPRIIYNTPFLGVSVDGQPRVLTTDLQGKHYAPVERPMQLFPPTDYTPNRFELPISGVKTAKSIDYFGHYPVVDMEFNTDLPVTVGVRAWSPFMPGDTTTSMMPAGVIEVYVRNPTNERHHGTLAISFPGFEPPIDAKGVEHTREKDPEGLHGVVVSSTAKGDSREMSYALASLDDPKYRAGGALNFDGAAWNSIEKQLPNAQPKDSGSSLAVDFDLGPGKAEVKRFVLAWHAPHWNASGAPGGSAREFEHMYAAHYPSAVAAAKKIADEHAALLRRIIAWQSELYQSKQIPGWLADSLINNLYLITETSVWGQGKGPLEKFGPEGLFALNECPRGCPQLECIPCSFYGNMPLVYFFPDAALSTLRGYKAYQFPDGRPPWIFGGCTATDPKNKAPYDLAGPDRGYQTVLNAASYIVMFDRYWRTTGDDQVLREFYPSLKKANDFSLNLRPKFGLSQVVSMPEPGTDGGGLGDTEWFEAPAPGWKGYVTHAGGVRMAQVQIMKRVAEAMDDSEYVEKCNQWLEAGAQALESKLWNGKYYLNFFDPDEDKKSDLIFGYQLDGQWICDAHGVAGVFPKERTATALDTIRHANCALSQSGATNYATADGKPATVGGYGTYGYFPPELMMLAMTYMYEGQQEFGTELLRRCMENFDCQWGYTWDAPNTIRGDMDTGQRHFGADYYQNMMLWFAPAALAGEDMTKPTKSGGLVNRIIVAARGESASEKSASTRSIEGAATGEAR